MDQGTLMIEDTHWHNAFHQLKYPTSGWRRDRDIQPKLASRAATDLLLSHVIANVAFTVVGMEWNIRAL